MSNLDKNEELKKAFDELLNSTTSLKRKKKNNTERKKEIFLKVVNLCESVITREVLLAADFKIHLDTYNEDFYIIMDSLLLLYLGKEGFELVSFYLYDRINPDGTINIQNKKKPIRPMHPLWVFLFQLKEKQPSNLEDCWKDAWLLIYKSMACKEIQCNVFELLLAYKMRRAFYKPAKPSKVLESSLARS